VPTRLTKEPLLKNSLLSSTTNDLTCASRTMVSKDLHTSCAFVQSRLNIDLHLRSDSCNGRSWFIVSSWSLSPSPLDEQLGTSALNLERTAMQKSSPRRSTLSFKTTFPESDACIAFASAVHVRTSPGSPVSCWRSTAAPLVCTRMRASTGDRWPARR